MRQFSPDLQHSPPASTNPVRPLRSLWLSLLLIGLTFATYSLAIQTAGFIWDDDQYVVQNPVLRTGYGLLAIWIHPTSIPQYYPLVHTTFWIEYHLWGTWPARYHFDNVLLHALW